MFSNAVIYLKSYLVGPLGGGSDWGGDTYLLLYKQNICELHVCELLLQAFMSTLDPQRREDRSAVVLRLSKRSSLADRALSPFK